MFAKLALWISLFLVVSCSSQADELFDMDNLQVSGYAYTTQFEDDNWYDDRTRMAVNLDYMYNNWAIRAQVSTDPDDALKRLFIERNDLLGSFETTVRVGRVARYESFYSSLDTPGGTGMVMLPNSGYAYRLLDGVLASIDGIQLEGVKRFEDTRVSAKYSYGKMVIPSQANIGREVFRDNWNEDIEITSIPVYNIGIHIDSGYWDGYYSFGTFSGVSHDNTSSAADFMTKIKNKMATDYIHEYRYNQDKLGLRYDNKSYWIQSEIVNSLTYADSVTEKNTYFRHANDVNLIIGKHIEDFDFYIGHSNGRNFTDETFNKESFIGATYFSGPWVTSVQYNNGQGHAWHKYDSNIDHWNSFLGSITYNF